MELKAALASTTAECDKLREQLQEEIEKRHDVEALHALRAEEKALICLF